MNSNSKPRPDPKKYWQSLPPGEKVRFRKLLGLKRNKIPTPAQIEVARAFEVTRKRIRDIEQRALRKLRRTNRGDSH
jgi:DNA-directed RNA polymerase sigma subunit (sigma70/sigma32)